MVDSAGCDYGEEIICGHCEETATVPSSMFSTNAIIDDFVVEKFLGKGGMGMVYRAHQISLDRTVALKILTPSEDMGAEAVDDFRRERLHVPSDEHHVQDIPTGDGRRVEAKSGPYEAVRGGHGEHHGLERERSHRNEQRVLEHDGLRPGARTAAGASEGEDVRAVRFGRYHREFGDFRQNGDHEHRDPFGNLRNDGDQQHPSSLGRIVGKARSETN